MLKFARPLANGVLGPPSQSLMFYSLKFFDIACLHGPSIPETDHLATTCRTIAAPFSTLDAPRVDFYRFLGTQGSIFHGFRSLWGSHFASILRPFPETSTFRKTYVFQRKNNVFRDPRLPKNT